MNHELIEILKAFVFRDNGHEGLFHLCYFSLAKSCGDDMGCSSCLLVKGWIGTQCITDMYLENTLRNLNEPGTIIHTQSVV